MSMIILRVMGRDWREWRRRARGQNRSSKEFSAKGTAPITQVLR
ncbi:MAG: hypothetical protein ACI9KS_002691 [Sulfitobacter sp.]